MPVCFQLFKKDTGEGPCVLSKIDDEMCQHFGVDPDPVKYLGGWFDCIGFRLALGRSFDEIREQLKGYVEEEKQRGNPNEGVEFYENMLLMLEYLNERYTSNSFREVGRRD